MKDKRDWSKRRAWYREYKQRPEIQARDLEYSRRPEVKARAQKRRQTQRGWLNRARTAASQKGLRFNLVLADIPKVPARCPILGLPLDRRDLQHLPTLDRIDNAKGYVRGNIGIISYRANTWKNNHTIKEVRALLRYMEKAK